jgi:hypothetical protein
MKMNTKSILHVLIYILALYGIIIIVRKAMSNDANVGLLTAESYRYNYSGTIQLKKNKYFFITPGYGKNERKNMMLTSHSVWFNKEGGPLKYESVDSKTFSILKSLTKDKLKDPKYNYLKKYLFYANPNEDGGNSIFDFNGNCWYYENKYQWKITAGYSKSFSGCPKQTILESGFYSYGSFVYTNDHKLSGPKFNGKTLFYVHPYGGADVKDIRNGTDIVVYSGDDQDAGDRIKVTINYIADTPGQFGKRFGDNCEDDSDCDYASGCEGGKCKCSYYNQCLYKRGVWGCKQNSDCASSSGCGWDRVCY